mgnify:CR=1 FL=1
MTNATNTPLTAAQMATRQQLADNLGAAAAAYANTMDEPTGRAFQAATLAAMRSDMPAATMAAIISAATARPSYSAGIR